MSRYIAVSLKGSRTLTDQLQDRLDIAMMPQAKGPPQAPSGSYWNQPQRLQRHGATWSSQSSHAALCLGSRGQTSQPIPPGSKGMGHQPSCMRVVLQCFSLLQPCPKALVASGPTCQQNAATHKVGAHVRMRFSLVGESCWILVLGSITLCPVYILCASSLALLNTDSMDRHKRSLCVDIRPRSARSPSTVKSWKT